MEASGSRVQVPHRVPVLTRVVVACYLLIQLALPMRALAYSGNSMWTEEGYRFGWRVMLIEKVGTAAFTVVDARGGTRELVDLSEYYTPYQIKQLSIQPDLILQAAKCIAGDYARRRGFESPAVYADVWVSLNGRRSRQLINSNSDLASQSDGLSPKPFILR